MNLNVKHKTIKLLEINIGENIDDLGYKDDFLDTTSKAWSMKEIIDKLGLIKIKKFCSVEDNLKGMKRQVTDWKVIFAKDIPDKGLLSKVYKDLLKFNNKKIQFFLFLFLCFLNYYLFIYFIFLAV